MTTYKFQTAFPVDTDLPRDQMQCSTYFDHTGGALTIPADLSDFCDDLHDVWYSHLAGTGFKIITKVYEAAGSPPHPPLHTHETGTVHWTCFGPREIALCLSFARDRHNKRQRGRIYFPIMLRYNDVGIRPSTAQMQAVLDLFEESNDSFPDLGGVDWQFGIWSKTDQAFHGAKEAWVDNEWDTQRRRGLRADDRLTSVREG
jgi:hypothetical protein